MGLSRRMTSPVREIKLDGGEKMSREFDKKLVEEAAKTPSFIKKPFGRFKGLTRDNTVVGTTGMPYAWGYTYRAPYRYTYQKGKETFDTRKMEFDYMATSILRRIRQMKHEVSLMSFLNNPIFTRRQRAIQARALDD